MPETRMDYPGIVVARKPVIAPETGERDRRAVEDWDAIAALLVWLEGHGGCGGWKFDHEADCLTCRCGAPLYEVAEPTGGHGSE